jgi:hypothetical protein
MQSGVAIGSGHTPQRTRDVAIVGGSLCVRNDLLTLEAAVPQIPPDARPASFRASQNGPYTGRNAIRWWFPITAVLLLSACWDGGMTGGPCQYAQPEDVVLRIVQVTQHHVMAEFVGPSESRFGSMLRSGDAYFEVARPEAQDIGVGDHYRARVRLIEKGSCAPWQLWLVAPLGAGSGQQHG